MRRTGPNWTASLERVGAIPPLVRAFAIADLLLMALYIADTAAGRPFGHFFDLNSEGNLPTAVASLQLLAVGALLALFAGEQFERTRSRSWLLWALPLLFAVLATDEVIGIHEKVGLRVDQLVPALNRKELLFDETGLWMFFVGVPFIAISVSFVYLMRDYFRSPGALTLAAIGFGIFMGGAIGVEMLSNFVEVDSAMHSAQVLVEEGAELIGVTLILWGVHRLVGAGSSAGWFGVVAKALPLRRTGARNAHSEDRTS